MESMVRRGSLTFTPEEGFWTLQLSLTEVCVYTSMDPFLVLSYGPRQIGIALDYDGRKVTLPMPELKRLSMNSQLPSLGEFFFSCGLII
jgi:hypothetical protein